MLPVVAKDGLATQKNSTRNRRVAKGAMLPAGRAASRAGPVEARERRSGRHRVFMRRPEAAPC